MPLTSQEPLVSLNGLVTKVMLGPKGNENPLLRLGPMPLFWEPHQHLHSSYPLIQGCAPMGKEFILALGNLAGVSRSSHGPQSF
jgi:hypothetical protein